MHHNNGRGFLLHLGEDEKAPHVAVAMIHLDPLTVPA
jgi:hypothetical protein